MTTSPVGLTRDLVKNRAMPAQVGETDVVIWRNTAGALAAWNNRCPHRGMRLSHGFVRGDSLACLYHGWQYDGSGRCSHIPAHPDLTPPASITTQVYSVVEAAGVIWVSVDGAATPQETDAGLIPLRTMTVHAGQDTIPPAAADTRLNGILPPEPRSAARYSIDGRDVVLLLSPKGAGTTVVTILVDGQNTVAEQRALSRWCETWRRRAEAESDTAA